MRKLILLLSFVVFISCSKSPRFRILNADHTGIDFNNLITETDSFNVLTYEYIYNGAGVGIGDLNNDGLQDIVFAGNQVTSKVYLNQGNFKFRDITSNFSGLTNSQWYSGVAIVDINNDRLLDVYLTSTKDKNPLHCKNRLWVNQGSKNGADPTFKEMAEEYGIAEDGQSVNAAFFDYDRDGDMDLYVLNNTVNQRMNTSYRPKIVNGSALNNDKLYRNEGNGKFTDVTVDAGIVYEGFGLGLAMGDINKDGYPDIYVSNDFISNDLLYMNQGDGTFRNEISKYMSYQTRSSMGNDMADVNNDGNLDMFTLDMLPENYDKKRQTINGISYMFYINDAKYGYEHQYVRNMFHKHNGFMNGEMLPFSETGQMMDGIWNTEWSWSPLFADYDNDGDKDLIVANGFPRDMTDKDWTRYKANFLGFLASERQVIEKAPPIHVPNMAFENLGELRFVQKTKEWLGLVPSYSYGASFTDLDNDGDLDYVVNNINDKAFICKNLSIERSKKKSHYIKIRLTGSGKNTMAVGAKIELWSKGNYQYTEHFLTRGYASSVDPVVHFGLGGNSTIDSIKVTWPATGNISVIKNITANQTIDIPETSSRPSSAIPDKLKKRNLLFEKQDSIIQYTHQQNDFVDFSLNQPIIPHKFSQIGPRMARGDIDSDGHEDLIIGSTNTLPTKVFLRKGNIFKETLFEGLTTLKDFSESDLAIFDMDGDGDKDVVAVAGGYENPENEYRHYLYENINGVFNRTDLPIPPFPASVVRPFDFDHDGDIDLFIGARVKKGMFPYSNHSWLIINDKGKFSALSDLQLNLGMVTDAIWTDYDKDGYEDLMVSREWNSMVILKNMNGKKLVPQNIATLEDHHGIWYSLIACDFDSDGDDDYIAGNLGDNNRFKITDQYPLNLYALDLDMDGVMDPVTTAFWKDGQGKMTEYPVNFLDELWSQSSFFQKKYTDYTTFSHAGIHDMFDENVLKGLQFKLYVNTTSSYIIWNNKGNFRWEKLPLPVQESPVKKMIAGDLNGDKLPDVIVSGNDYSYDLETGYFDANKGIVLINKGMDSFDILPPSASGMLLQGMVESLLYFDGDPSLVVAGMNRAKINVFKLRK